MSAPGTGRPSNGTEGEQWMHAWCRTCIHDKPAGEGRPESGCQILLEGLMGGHPQQWRRGPFWSPQTVVTCDEWEWDNPEREGVAHE